MDEYWRELSAKLWAANILGERTDWTLNTHPSKTATGARRAVEAIREWASIINPPQKGVLLFGGAGTGKTGLGIAAARSKIESELGADYFWMLAGNEPIKAAVEGGRMRRRVAPVFFKWWSHLSMDFRWATTSSGEDDERPNDLVLFSEYRERCQFLVLDDIDVGEYTPFKEQTLLNFINLVEEGMFLVVTMNKAPHHAVELLGERVVDRLVGKFLCQNMAGPTLRSQ